LAIASFVVGVASCPCLFRALIVKGVIDGVSARNYEPVERIIVYGPSLLGLCLGLVALLRVLRSRGRLHGMGWAVAAIVLSAFWFAAFLAIRLWDFFPVPNTQ